VTSDPGYTSLPAASAHAVAIGGALISMVEPHPGTERAYNRWYEDDHYYSGALAMPWMFAGKRFVATRDLQLLRYPEPSAVASPVSAGCYLHLYWITEGHVEDHVRWSVSTNVQLRAGNRIHLERTHVFTAFHDFAASRGRDVHGPRDYHTLDRGYPAVLFEVIDAHEGTPRADLLRWIADDYVPWVQQRPHSPVAHSVWFTPQPLPADKQPDVADSPAIDRRVTVVHFLEEDPRLHWETLLRPHGERVDAGGLGSVELGAPFIAVVHGTDRYVDELR
jgi:hypothetical protein